MKAWFVRNWKSIAAVAVGIGGSYVCPILPAPYSAPCSMVTSLVNGLIGQ